MHDIKNQRGRFPSEVIAVLREKVVVLGGLSYL